MGTRAIVAVKDELDNKIIELYSQYDGYPDGLGRDLKEFVASREMVNGIGANRQVFNGIHCFAAQLISHFKDEAGGYYLYPPTKNYKNKGKYWDKYGAEYYYEIDSDLNVRCWDTYENKEIILKGVKNV